MCIIVAKPMNVSMPTVETLRTCFLVNPDGAGFMYADGKMVKIRKGFMEFEDFLKALDEEIPEAERTETAIVMHFRIATHGKVQPGCCHPFPVSDERDELLAPSTKSRMGVAHNGIIHGRTTNDNWSDTMDFVANVVTPLMRMNPSFIHNGHAADLLDGACNSKLAIMDNAGDIMTVGQFIDDDGVLYSNSSYLKLVSSWSSYGSMWERGYSGRGYWGFGYDDYGYGYATTSNACAKGESAYGEELDELIKQLPWDSCQECLWAEECALTYPVCDGEREARNLSQDIYAEEAEKELIDMGHEEADPERYQSLVQSNNEALANKGFLVD